MKAPEKILDLIPGKRLLSVVWMELKVIMSQWIVLGLIMLMLVLVVITIGLAFTGKTGLDQITVSMYVPDGLQGFDAHKFRQMLEDSNKVAIMDYNSAEEVMQSIYNRETKIGIVVHEPEAKYGRYVIDLILDNSNVATSAFFFEIARQNVQAIGFSTSRELLVEIWNNLDRIQANLKNETFRIDGFIDQLQQSEARLVDLNRSVYSINIEEMRQLLDDQRNRSTSIRQQLDVFTSDIVAFSSEIDGISGTIADSKEKLAQYSSEAESVRNSLEQYDSELESIQSELTGIKQALGESAPSEIQLAIDEVSGARQEIQSSLDGLDAAQEDIDNTMYQLDDMQDSIDGIEEKLANADQSINSLKTQLNSTFDDFNAMDLKLSSLGGTVDEVKLLIEDAVESKKIVDANLLESKTIMGNFINSLGELQQLRPEFLSNPVIINKISAYKADKFTILVPALIAIVIMLTSILLSAVSFIVQKKQGAYLRMAGSTTGKGTIFAGKITGQILFAAVETAVIILVAAAFFNVKILGSLPDLVIAVSIVSFSFVSLGIFITNFTRGEGTTLLTGLVIMIPMIFLSGLIMPIELMSVLIQEVAQKLPLTIAITFLTEVMVKGNSLANLLTEALLLIVSSAIFVLFTILNKKVD